jgi:DNA topoisomerase-1
MIKREGNYEIGFKYFKNNREITSKKEIDKIKALKIPPAYQNVTIVNTNKIIAYGYDSKGRKQVIYQPDYVKQRSDAKFNKIFDSIKVFKKIKNHIARDMKTSDPKKKNIAMIIYMIFTCGFRIGNKKYEKMNNSTGLTTLKFSHLKFKDGKIDIDFIGKKGVRNTSCCNNKLIYDYMYNKSLSSNKDDYVFTYASEQLPDKQVTSYDVNEYLKSIHNGITSKDLRTWNANYLFMKFFKQIKQSQQGMSKNLVKKAMEMVAHKLHNTYSICKKSYIDPKLVKYIEEKHKAQE